MGNMPLLPCCSRWGPAAAGRAAHQIILAAPDVEPQSVRRTGRHIKHYGRGVTLYCSSKRPGDGAARRVAAASPRGDVPIDGPIVLSGIDTIDVSQTSTDYLALNHSSYAERGALLDDIGQLLQTGERPPERRTPSLLRIVTPKGDFWRYPLIRG